MVFGFCGTPVPHIKIAAWSGPHVFATAVCVQCSNPVVVGLLGSQASGSGGDIAHSAAGGMLEVRLICHPLVTMVPDIRYSTTNCSMQIGKAWRKACPVSMIRVCRISRVRMHLAQYHVSRAWPQIGCGHFLWTANCTRISTYIPPFENRNSKAHDVCSS